MTCPICQHENREEARFCEACGASLSGQAADRVADLRQRMPRSLTDKILAARGELAGERKPVTVVFADISGFTAMSERMDAEEVRNLVNRCFEALVEVVYRYEGVVDKFIGDEIMALFGAPVAHENDPARVRGLTPGRAPLVGRAREVAHIQQAVDALMRGEGGVLCITGEAGIGKSRLKYELTGMLSDRGTFFVEGACTSYEVPSPYQVVGQVCRELLSIEEEEPSEQIREKLTGAVGSALAPYLGSVIGVRYEEVLLVEDAVRQQRACEAVVDLELAESLLTLRLPDEVRAVILKKAEGNPFYIEEVLKMFIDEGVVARTRRG